MYIYGLKNELQRSGGIPLGHRLMYYLNVGTWERLLDPPQMTGKQAVIPNYEIYIYFV